MESLWHPLLKIRRSYGPCFYCFLRCSLLKDKEHILRTTEGNNNNNGEQESITSAVTSPTFFFPWLIHALYL